MPAQVGWEGRLQSLFNTVSFGSNFGTQPTLTASTTVTELTTFSHDWILGADAGATLTLSGTTALSVTSGTLTVNAPLKIGGSQPTLTAGAGSATTVTLNGVISGAAAGIIYTSGGTATWQVMGANTYGGSTTFTNGAPGGIQHTETIVIGNQQAFSTSQLNMNTPGTTFTAGTDLTGTSQLSNRLSFSGASLAFNNNLGYNLELGGAMLVTGTAHTITAAAGVTTFDGVISGTGHLSWTTTSGSVVLNGLNTASGGMTLTGAGGVSVSQIGADGAAGSLGTATTTFGSGGRLTYTGAGETSSHLFNLGSTGGEIDANGSGALILTADLASAAGTKVLTLGGTSASANQISGAISDGSSGTTAVTKTGTGTWVLTGANTYTGGTTVTAGTLTLGADNTLAAATGALVINGGNLAAGGNNTLGGNLTLTSGKLTVGANLITLGSGSNLVLSGGTINVTLGSVFGQIAGTGTLTATGGSLVLNTNGTGFSYNSSYQIFSGFGSSDLSGLSLTGYDTADYTAALSNSGDLSFSAVPEPSTSAVIFGAAALGFAVYRRAKNRPVGLEQT